MSRLKVVFKVVAVLAVAGVGLVGAGIAILASQDLDRLRQVVEERVSAATGRSLSITGDIHITPAWVPTLGADGVRLANAEWSSEPEMLRAGRLQAEIELLPLLRGEVRLHSFRLSGGTVLLERRADGAANWQFTANNADESREGAPWFADLDTVEISDFAARYRDALTGHDLDLHLDALRLNVADLGFGTASAKTIAVSFWIKSSLTGTFGGIIGNPANNRRYPFSFSIDLANTWEFKTLAIPGDTTGTWPTTNGVGLLFFLDTGSGSTIKGTAGAWAASNVIGVTGGTNLVATAAATMNITGVQLEIGNAATEFERRPFGQELALCQRYYWKTFASGTAPAQNVGFVGALCYRAPIAGASINTVAIRHPVQMRSTPAATYYNPGAANTKWRNRSLTQDSGDSGDTVDVPSADGWAINNGQAAGDAATNLLCIHAAFAAEL